LPFIFKNSKLPVVLPLLALLPLQALVLLVQELLVLPVLVLEKLALLVQVPVLVLLLVPELAYQQAYLLPRVGLAYQGLSCH
jgi:hypothetical protein